MQRKNGKFRNGMLNGHVKQKPNGKIAVLKRQILPILKKHNVVRAGLFGSVVRGEARKKSDIDVLIKFDAHKRKSLFDFVGLKLDLEDRLKKKVDVVEYDAIKPFLKEIILKEEVRIL